MQGVAQVCILPADDRKPRRQLGVNSAADERNDSTTNPGQQNQWGGVDSFRDQIGINENSGADNSADHCHRCAEQTERSKEPLPSRCGIFGRHQGSVVSSPLAAKDQSKLLSSPAERPIHLKRAIYFPPAALSATFRSATN